MESEEQAKSTDKAIISQQEIAIYQGQFPHPDILKGFAEVVPDMPEQILKMAEEHNKGNLIKKVKTATNFLA